MLLLEKKQRPVNTAAQTETVRNDVHDKGSPGPVVNEPSPEYQASNENNIKSWTDKGIAGSDDSGMESLQKNGSGASQNEDDLPF